MSLGKSTEVGRGLGTAPGVGGWGRPAERILLLSPSPSQKTSILLVETSSKTLLPFTLPVEDPLTKCSNVYTLKTPLIQRKRKNKEMLLTKENNKGAQQKGVK